jgi:hypothetical protein
VPNSKGTGVSPDVVPEGSGRGAGAGFGHDENGGDGEDDDDDDDAKGDVIAIGCEGGNVGMYFT